MNIRNEEIYLPPELVVILLTYAIKNEFKDVLSFRLVTRALSEITDYVSMTVSSELFDDTAPKIQQASKKVPSCLSFFKFSQFEARRYQFNIDSQINPSSLKDFRSAPLLQEGLNVDLLTSMRNEFLPTRELPLILGQIPLGVQITERGPLPDRFTVPLTKLIRIRGFEAIKKLLENIKNNKQINLNRVIDYIYDTATKNYHVFEFIQLMDAISIDVNRLVGGVVHSDNFAPGEYVRSPLLHFTVDNAGLMNYLIERGANFHAASEKGETVLDLLNKKLNNCKEPDRQNMLQKLASIIRAPFLFEGIPFDKWVIDKGCLELPRVIESLLTILIAIREFELIKQLLERMKDKNTINLDRVIDYIYSHGVRDFKVSEFTELRDVVPIDINRLAIVPVLTGWQKLTNFEIPLVVLALDNPKLVKHFLGDVNFQFVPDLLLQAQSKFDFWTKQRGGYTKAEEYAALVRLIEQKKPREQQSTEWKSFKGW